MDNLFFQNEIHDYENNSLYPLAQQNDENKGEFLMKSMTQEELDYYCDKHFNNDKSCNILIKTIEIVNIKKEENKTQKEIEGSKKVKFDDSIEIIGNNSDNNNISDCHDKLDVNQKIATSNRKSKNIIDNKNSEFISRKETKDNSNNPLFTTVVTVITPERKANIIKKINALIIDMLLHYANELIKNYKEAVSENKKTKKITIKRLYKIKGDLAGNTHVQSNKDLLEYIVKDILSRPITEKASKHESEHNEKQIDKIEKCNDNELKTIKIFLNMEFQHIINGLNNMTNNEDKKSKEIEVKEEDEVSEEKNIFKRLKEIYEELLNKKDEKSKMVIRENITDYIGIIKGRTPK